MKCYIRLCNREELCLIASCKKLTNELDLSFSFFLNYDNKLLYLINLTLLTRFTGEGSIFFFFPSKYQFVEN